MKKKRKTKPFKKLASKAAKKSSGTLKVRRKTSETKIKVLPSATENKIHKTERRRIARLAISRELFKVNENGKIYSVVNLSERGMALRVIDPPDMILFTIGRSLSGILNLRKQTRVPLRIKIKHIRAHIIGCEFEKPEIETIRVLKEALDPKFLGAELKPLPGADLGTIWYHGPSGTDLLLKRGHDGQYQRLMVYVLGQFVEWDVESGLKTGACLDSSEPGLDLGMIHYEKVELDPDPKPDDDKLDIAKKVILSSKIPKDLQTWCVRRLYGS